MCRYYRLCVDTVDVEAMHNLSCDQLIYPRSSPEVIDIVSGGERTQRTRLQAHGNLFTSAGKEDTKNF